MKEDKKVCKSEVVRDEKKQKYTKPEIKEIELHSLDPTNDIACVGAGSGTTSTGGGSAM